MDRHHGGLEKAEMAPQCHYGGYNVLNSYKWSSCPAAALAIECALT
jgi:hypothetical protein